MIDITPEELIEKQRKFVHDISSQLMIAMGMVETSMSGLKNGQIGEKELGRLEKAQTALNKMSTMLRDHRSELKSIVEE